MITVQVDLGPRSYPVFIGKGILESLGALMKELDYGERALLVSDRKVLKLYGGLVQKCLAGSGFDVITGEIGGGEECKTLATAQKLYDSAFAGELDRRCPVVALGGGVVGDISGFVAATYMRGIPFVQVPTTLLAQVDSSVGGKVAVNHPRGKNIIGAFYQPGLVLADTTTLSTLPPVEVSSGLAEVIKYGIIADEAFFNWLEEHVGRLLSLDHYALEHAVAVSCRIKAGVVEKDETEQGLRAILNYGHTVGHALEALTGYSAYTHGEALGIGMAAAARIAVAMDMLTRTEAERIVSLLVKARLPVELPPAISPDDLITAMRLDKKSLAGRLSLVLPEKIGQVSLVRDVPEEVVNKSLLWQNNSGF